MNIKSITFLTAVPDAQNTTTVTTSIENTSSHSTMSTTSEPIVSEPPGITIICAFMFYFF